MIHPTKRQVRRLVELTGEMAVADIADRIGVSVRHARKIVTELVELRYLIERREPAPGAVPGVERLMVRSSGRELPPDPRQSSSGGESCMFAGDWWPKADQIVEAAMRGMVGVGRVTA